MILLELSYKICLIKQLILQENLVQKWQNQRIHHTHKQLDTICATNSILYKI